MPRALVFSLYTIVVSLVYLKVSIGSHIYEEYSNIAILQPELLFRKTILSNMRETIRSKSPNNQPDNSGVAREYRGLVA